MSDTSLQPFPPIWVINLKRSTSRREYIEHHLRSFGLTYELIEAVDGREISDEQVAQLQKEAEKARMFNVAYNLAKGKLQRKSVIGCSLSHRKCWQRMIDEGIEEVLILEDDIVLTADFVEILKRRHLFPQHWERMNFRSSTLPLLLFGTPIYRHYQLAKFLNFDLGTLCYFLRRSAAEKLLEQNFAAYLSVDIHTGRDCVSGCVSGTVAPFPTALKDIPSDIGYPNSSEPHWTRRIAHDIYRWSMRPFYRLLIRNPIVWIMIQLRTPPPSTWMLLYNHHQKTLLQRKAKQDIRFILKQRQAQP